MSKSQGFKLNNSNAGNQNGSVKLQMSPNKQFIIAGASNLKIMSIKTENDYWFQVKKVINRFKSPTGETTLFTLNALSMSKNNKLALAYKHSDLYDVIIYDISDFNRMSKYQYSIEGISTKKQMKRILWGPEQHILTMQTCQELMRFDARCKQVVMTIQAAEDRISEFNYNPVNPNLLAFTSDAQKINIYDVRNPREPVAFSEDSYRGTEPRKIPIEWSPDGKMVANSFESKIKIWNINGQSLQQFDRLSCSEQINKMKWLKEGDFFFLVGQNKPPRLCKYDLRDPNRYVGEYLMTNNSQQMSDWIIDNDEQLIVTATSLLNINKDQNQTLVAAQFSDNLLDYWKGKYNCPVQFDWDNNLIFTTRKWQKQKTVHSNPVILTEREQTSIAINDYLYFNDFSREQLLSEQLQREKQQKREQRKLQKRELSRKLTEKMATKQESIKSLDKYDIKLRRQSISKEDKKYRDESLTKIYKQKSSDNRSVKKSIRSLSQISSSDNEQKREIEPRKYLTSKKQQYMYLIKNYRLDIENGLQSVVQHNSQVASRLGKSLCMEFWILLFSLVHPSQQGDYSIEDLYESNSQCQISITNNKIVALCEDEPKLLKEEYYIEHAIQIIQKLVDENELQTAVIGASILQKIKPAWLEQRFYYGLLAQYKKILTKMDYAVKSIEISHYIHMSEFDTGYNINYRLKMKCLFCRKKISDCQCGLLCIFCGKQMRSGFITLCKICGHGAHTREYEKWFVEDKNIHCPYGCGHSCFNQKSLEMKLKKICKDPTI